MMEITQLSDIPEATVQEVYELITQLVQEANPDIDTRRGVISELVLGLDAIVMAGQLTNTRLVNQSQSIVTALQSESTSEEIDEIIDKIASNYRVTRRQATYASGSIMIVLNSQVPITITKGTQFTAQDVTFTSDESYTARLTSSEVVLSTDRLLVQYGSYWCFPINVTATTAGTKGNLDKNTKLLWDGAPSYFVTAYAVSNFTNGQNAQTNSELINLLLTNFSTKAWANRPMIRNLIINADSSYSMVTSDFADIQDISIIGGFDREMLRDQHWIFPISGGGKIDLYLRSKQLPSVQDITVEGVFDSVTGKWSASISRDDFPGLYEIREIRPATALPGDDTRTFAETRGYDTSGNIYVPDITSDIEASFTRYQTIALQIDEPNPGEYVNGEKQDFSVTVCGFPLIKEVQEYVGHDDIRPPAGDCLVRAGIPCFLSLTVNLEKQNDDATISESDLADALMTYVNTLGFTHQLYASGLIAAIDPLLTNVKVDTIMMSGTLLKPDLSTVGVGPSTSVLSITEDYDLWTTRNTIIFILEMGNIIFNLSG